MRKNILLYIVLFSSLSVPLFPQQGQVTIPLAEYRSLLSKNASGEFEKPLLNYLFSRADYEVLAGESATEVIAEYTVETLREGWCQVPLFSRQIPIVNATIDGEKALLSVQQDQYWLLFRTIGQYKAKINFLLPALDSAKFIRIPLPEVAISTMKIRIAKGKNFSIRPPAHVLASKEQGNFIEHTIQIPPIQNLEMALYKPVPVSKPNIYGTLDLVVFLGEGRLQGEAIVQYDIRHAPVRTFSLQLPDGIAIDKVMEESGAAVEWREDTVGKNKKLFWQVAQAIEGQHSFVVHFTKELTAIATTTAIPSIEMSGVSRQAGHLAIVARTNIEVVVEEAKNITVIDPLRLPPALQNTSSLPILFAFKHHNNYALRIKTERHRDVPVQIASIDSVEAVTFVSHYGQCITKYALQMRNNHKQMLKFRLPRNSELVSALLAGNPVKPGMDEDGRILIPIQKSRRIADTISSFAVEIAFRHKMNPPNWWGDGEFSLPSADLPITSLNWSLHVPEGYKYLDLSDDLQRGSIDIPAVWSLARTSYPGIFRQQREPTKPGSGQGQDDWNSNIADNHSPGTEAILLLPESEERSAGLLPVPVHIPVSNVQLQFSRRLLNGDESVSVRLHFASNKIIYLFLWAFVALFTVHLYRQVVKNREDWQKPHKLDSLWIVIAIATCFVEPYLVPTYLAMVTFALVGLLFLRYRSSKVED